jgi:hypothetical protein
VTEIRTDYFPLEEKTEEIIGLGFEVYNELGFGFLEIVYKDALEYEFNRNEFLFSKCSNCQVGLILNFARKGLQIKWVVF